jgi:Zn-finger nucleic acid-binding protein
MPWLNPPFCVRSILSVSQSPVCIGGIWLDRGAVKPLIAMDRKQLQLFKGDLLWQSQLH